MPRRYPDDSGFLSLAAGDYGLNPTDGKWYARVPDKRFHLGSLAHHEVKEFDDGTITVQPSIQAAARIQGKLVRWHGYLERGAWREIGK